MSERDKIPSSTEGPLMPPPRRVDHLDKARRLKEQAQGKGSLAEPKDAQVTKVTTRVLTEQIEWLKAEAKSYRERNPRRPRVTVEELFGIAIDHLRESKNLDAVIAKYRS